MNFIRESVEEISYFFVLNFLDFGILGFGDYGIIFRNLEWVLVVLRVIYIEWLFYVFFWNRVLYRVVYFECCNNILELFYFVDYFVVVLIFNIGEIEYVSVLIGRGNLRIRFGRYMLE